MGDLAGLHAQARRLILALRSGLDRLEAQEGMPGGTASPALAKDMHSKLLDLQRTSREMDALFRMQAMGSTANGQLLWKRKVEQVAEEADHLRTAFDRQASRERRKQIEEQERAELLARRSNAPNWQSEMEAEAAVRGNVSNSRRILDEAFETGTAILGSMSSQRDTLKAAQRKALDVINSVGLSDSLLRVIDRRQRMDRWITYGGMVLATCLLIGMWWWLRR